MMVAAHVNIFIYKTKVRFWKFLLSFFVVIVVVVFFLFIYSVRFVSIFIFSNLFG